jgi:hypothetical protein
MGIVTFGIPLDLARALVKAGKLTGAIETGTYHGDSAIALRRIVPRVLSIELLESIYEEAVENVDGQEGIVLIQGYSPDVLADLAQEIEGPVLFWLDGHGGTFGGNDVPANARECPVIDELRAIERFPFADRSCFIIDDARAFFGPMLQHDPSQWPTFIEISDLLRSDIDRYVTVLDDVIIAVPPELRHTVDEWWLKKLRARGGLEASQRRIQQLSDPSSLEAFLRLGRSFLPSAKREQWTKVLRERGVHAPAPRRSPFGTQARSPN